MRSSSPRACAPRSTRRRARRADSSNQFRRAVSGRKIRRPDAGVGDQNEGKGSGAVRNGMLMMATKATKEKTITAATIGLLGSVAVIGHVAAEQKFQKLTGAQIQARFAGMELTDEAHWGEVFERNGTLTITSMGHKSIGKWRVQKDQLCLETGKEPGAGCYEVWLSGRNVELRNQASSVPLEVVLQKPNQSR